MSGYAASARILSASPRVMRHDAVEWIVDWAVSDSDAVVVDAGRIVHATRTITLAERWERFRDRWAQLTFFVTDAESWR
jgi:hypothetical protein